jgi:quercetin dioxygenase-like cupin family protein
MYARAVAHADQVIHGHDGFRLCLIRTAAETEGELLEMEATYGGGGQLPPEHFHPGQVERFEVLDGAVRTDIDGVDRRYQAGEVFEVPARTRHQMTGDGPARVRWQVTPALRTAEFFERLYGSGTADVGGQGGVAEFLDEFRDEIQFTAP